MTAPAAQSRAPCTVVGKPWTSRFTAPLLAIVAIAGLFACRPPPETPVGLAFDLRSSRASEATLRFYVSGLSMIDAAGLPVPVRLDPVSPWQNETTALVSFAGDSGGFDATDNRVVSGQVAPGRYAALEFNLGVPFERNHGNPLAAPPPLNVPSMFWTWQTGYKFLRLDVGNEWSFHLGSTGCVSPSAVRPPATPCRQPNIARVRLAVKAGSDATIVVDLDSLLAGIDTSTQDNCMDAYAERQACRALLATLGIDPDTGDCVDGCAGQTVFRLADTPDAG